MPIYLDTGNIKEIEKHLKMGVVRGVTTNPTILLKDGITGGVSVIREKSIEIAKLIHPYPLSVEVTTNDVDKMTNQAREFAQWAENIVVKITIHGPNGELENLETIHELETKHDVRVNTTAMMSAQQCLLAAMAGSSYVSLFGGRVNNMGYDSRIEIKRLRKLLDDFDFNAKIIIGSTREVVNIIEWLEAGAHIVTVLPSFIKGMIVHPYSKETVQMFLNDAEKADKKLAE